MTKIASFEYFQLEYRDFCRHMVSSGSFQINAFSHLKFEIFYPTLAYCNVSVHAEGLLVFTATLVFSIISSLVA